MEYKLIKSKRKTVSITVEKDASITVKAPISASKAAIEQLLEKHRPWIEKRQRQVRERASRRAPLSPQQIEEMKKLARDVMERKTRYFARIMGVKYKYVKITSAKTRWGSCSADNAICYSYRTMLLTDRQRDYIAIHELAHIKQKNHSGFFYAEIEKVMPDYRQVQKSIKDFENLDLY